jgi:hypothetical protein
MGQIFRNQRFTRARAVLVGRLIAARGFADLGRHLIREAASRRHLPRPRVFAQGNFLYRADAHAG